MWRDKGWEEEVTDRIKEHHLSAKNLQTEPKQTSFKTLFTFHTFLTEVPRSKVNSTYE